MGFAPKLIFADACLIASILIAWFIQKNNPDTTIRMILIVVAIICLCISIGINFVNAQQKRKGK